MALQVSGDGVCECTDRLLAASDVGENGELGVEQLARFADRDLERDPVSGGGHSSRLDSIRAQPVVDSLGGISGRGSKRLDLKKILSTFYLLGKTLSDRTCSLDSHSLNVGLPGVLACSSAFSKPSWLPIARLIRMSMTISAGAVPERTNEGGAEARCSWTNHDWVDAPYTLAGREEMMTQVTKGRESMVVDSGRRMLGQRWCEHS